MKLYSASALQTPLHGMGSWPASASALAAGRSFLRQAAGASSEKRILLVPDKDADGLCAAGIVSKTLKLLECKPEIVVHPVIKGEHVHQDAVRQWIKAHDPAYLVVMDLGSRSGSIIDGLPTLLIDHHQPEGFPDGATVVSAADCPPVATSSLLAYLLCRELHPAVVGQADWLAVLGTVGDLGIDGLKQFYEQMPELQGMVKKHAKSHFTESVSLINAARRCAACDVATAWQAVSSAVKPVDIASGTADGAVRLKYYRSETQEEVSRCARVPPRFSDDGRIAMLTISSGAQVHPLIAQRWTGRLKKSDRTGKLQVVMCANDAYLPGKVNFAARATDKGTDLIMLLKDAVNNSGISGLREKLGHEFARGHKQATGGMVPEDVWPLLLQALQFSAEGLAGKRKAAVAATAGASAGKRRALAAEDGSNGDGSSGGGNARGGKQAKLTAFFTPNKGAQRSQ